MVSNNRSNLLGYAERDQTRREHLAELMRVYCFTTFGVKDYRALSVWLTEQARGTDNGLALVTLLTAEMPPPDRGSNSAGDRTVGARM